MKIYVVMGTCGEYSDRTEWPVCAFVSEDLARELGEKATKRAAEVSAAHDAEPYYVDEQEYAKKNEYDPGMNFNYTGTTYYLMPVELRKSVIPKTYRGRVGNE